MGGIVNITGLFVYVMTAALVGITAMLTTLEASIGSDPFTWLINLGVAGIVIVLLVTGQLRTKAEVENLQKENAKKDEQLAKRDEVLNAVQAQLMEQTLPTLAKSARVIEQVPTSERGLVEELHETQRMLREMVARNNQSQDQERER